MFDVYLFGVGMGKADEKLYCALKEGAASYFVSTDGVRPLYYDQFAAADDLINIEQAFWGVASTKSKILSVKRVKPYGNEILEPSKSWWSILAGLRSGECLDFNMYPMHDLSPAIDEFIKCAKKRGLFGIGSLNFASLMFGPVAAADAVNAFAEEIRRISRSKDFKERVKSRLKAANKNYIQLNACLDSLFKKYSKLCVVRLDVGYEARPQDGSYSRDGVSYLEAKKHREMLFNEVGKGKLLEYMVGYAWKMAYSKADGLRYHLMLVFDGSKVTNDAAMAKMIGDYWSNNVTKGAGFYFICGGNNLSYKCCGTGMISSEDDSSREGVRKAAFFMTKSDSLIRFAAPGRGRIFGRSSPPKANANRSCKAVK